jgi:RNA polymerase sigma factor (sigma-70 family)
MIESLPTTPSTATGLGLETDWAALVQRYQPLLYGICRRFALTREESDDAVQHTWLKLYENRAALRQPEKVAGWLATTVRRECIALRAARWRESAVAEPPAASIDTDLSEVLARRHAHERLLEALEQLPLHERCVVQLLLDPEEPSYAEMSERLGTPIGSIGPRRGRALQKLRLLLDDLFEEDEVCVAFS